MKLLSNLKRTTQPPKNVNLSLGSKSFGGCRIQKQNALFSHSSPTTKHFHNFARPPSFHRAVSNPVVRTPTPFSTHKLIPFGGRNANSARGRTMSTQTEFSSNWVRQKFLQFFSDRGHQARDSASLIPHGDKSLLFTTAGMVPFKNYFLHPDQAPGEQKFCSIQKCLRTNDLELVGKTARHHSFFEMMGFFSFARNYGKSEAIGASYEFLTRELALDTNKLHVTVHEQDVESLKIWREQIGVPPHHISVSNEDNFWSMGATGPCGPCTEIYYDQGRPDSDGESFLEIWNLVFSSYNRLENGTLEPLPRVCVDTGMGLERITSVLQGKSNNFDSDLFLPIIKATGSRFNKLVRPDNLQDFRVIADHIRAIIFLIADGILPSNDGPGYVLRRLIRRAVNCGKKLGFPEEPWLSSLFDAVVETHPDYATFLAQQKTMITTIITGEEIAFFRTLSLGLNLLHEEILKVRQSQGNLLTGNPGTAQIQGDKGSIRVKSATVNEAGDLQIKSTVPTESNVQVKSTIPSEQGNIQVKSTISSDSNLEIQSTISKVDLPVQSQLSLSPKTIFTLYDTYGFPLDLSYSIAEENDLRVDRNEVQTYIERQREIARQGAWIGSETNAFAETKSWQFQHIFPHFSGYHTLKEEASKVEAVTVHADEAWIAINPCPFYAEGGGQIGDTGTITCSDGTILDVIDCKRPYEGGIAVKVGSAAAQQAISSHSLRVGATVTAQVFEDKRSATARNHTATHLLHCALKKVLKHSAYQAGSEVNQNGLRFDFMFPRALTQSEIEQVEDTVNTFIEQNIDVTPSQLPIERAKQIPDIVYLFDEKYPDDEVRVINIPEVSAEFCGGTHVTKTGEIGAFKIITEKSSAAGKRRIEALTASKAIHWYRTQAQRLRNMASLLDVPQSKLEQKVERLVTDQKQLEKDLFHSVSTNILNNSVTFSGPFPADTAKKISVTLLCPSQAIPPSMRETARNCLTQLQTNQPDTTFILASPSLKQVYCSNVDQQAIPILKEFYKALDLPGKCGGKGGFAQGQFAVQMDHFPQLKLKIQKWLALKDSNPQELDI